MILPLSKNGVEPYYSKTCESCFKQASNNVSVSSICFHECGKFNSSHGQLAQMQGVSMVYCSGRKRQNPSIRVKARTGALRNRSISGLRRKWPVFGHLCRRPLCGGFCNFFSKTFLCLFRRVCARFRAKRDRPLPQRHDAYRSSLTDPRSLCGGFWACERVSERSVTSRYQKISELARPARI